MTFRELLAFGATYLAGRGIEQPRTEAELLVREAAGVSTSYLFAHPDDPVPERALERAQGFLRRRGRGEPSAYVVGRKEFYGLTFQVDPRVLIPRPETEMLVDMGIAAGRRMLEERSQDGARRRHAPTLADIGTGSGAVAVSVAVNVPQVKVYATDNSRAALQVAALNCERHAVSSRVILLPGDLLRPVPAPVDVILANLPYIKDADLAYLQPEIREFEPHAALRGGRTGLNVIRRLLKQAVSRLSMGGMIAFEIAWDQGRAAAGLARTTFPGARVEVWKDLAGLDRVVEVDLRPPTTILFLL